MGRGAPLKVFGAWRPHSTWSLNTPTRVAPAVLTAAWDPAALFEPVVPPVPPPVPVEPPVVPAPFVPVPVVAPGTVSPDPVVFPPVVEFRPGASVVFDPLLADDDTLWLLWWLTAKAPTMAASSKTTEAVSRPSRTLACRLRPIGMFCTN